MKLSKFICPSLIALLLFAGCGEPPTYFVTDYGADADYKVVELQTYDKESDWFTFKFNETIWTLEEWEDVPNGLALVHGDFEDAKCHILPGTIGQGTAEENLAYGGKLLTADYVAETIDITNPAGILLQHIVGYEEGENVYIFEVIVATRDQDKCMEDAQAVISSFHVNVVEEVETGEIFIEEVVEEDDEELSIEEAMIGENVVEEELEAETAEVVEEVTEEETSIKVTTTEETVVTE
jgi:hypothetical protein